MPKPHVLEIPIPVKPTIKEIKPNMTVKVIATKLHNGETPPIVTSIDMYYEKLERARETLLESDLSENQVLAKYAHIAQDAHKDLQAKVEHYKIDLMQRATEFENSVTALMRPIDANEALLMSTYSTFLLNQPKGSSLSLAQGDPLLARVVLNMPPSLQKLIGFTEDSTDALKNSILDGYTEEKDRYTKLIDNAETMGLAIARDLQPAYKSPAVIKALNQETALNAI